MTVQARVLVRAPIQREFERERDPGAGPGRAPTGQEARRRLARPRALVLSSAFSGVSGLPIDEAAASLGVLRSTIKRRRRQVQQSPRRSLAFALDWRCLSTVSRESINQMIDGLDL